MIRAWRTGSDRPARPAPIIRTLQLYTPKHHQARERTRDINPHTTDRVIARGQVRPGDQRDQSESEFRALSAAPAAEAADAVMESASRRSFSSI